MIMSKFELGNIMMTEGIIDKCDKDEDFLPFITSAIQSHKDCDWGVVCGEDWYANNIALKEGKRLISKYTHFDTTIWVITEADRSVTTILLPEEY